MKEWFLDKLAYILMFLIVLLIGAFGLFIEGLYCIYGRIKGICSVAWRLFQEVFGW